MRPSMPFLVSCCLVCGCGANEPRVFLQGRLAQEGYTEAELKVLSKSLGFRPSRLGWFTPSELDHIARRYARRQGLTFDFRGTAAEVAVTRERDTLATVAYDHGIGRPFFSVTIAPDGTVVEHHLGTIICRLRDLPGPPVSDPRNESPDPP